MLTALWFIAGLVALVVGAEVFVRGASTLAAALRISPLVIGLTVVAFGTSAPELAVSLQASLSGQANLAFGNVVGSNIFNILFILGLSALITPLVVAGQLIRLDVPLLIGASFLLLGLGLDERIGRVDGLGLFALILVYTAWLVRQSRKEGLEVEQEFAKEYGAGSARARVGQLVFQVLLMVVGLALLVLGSRWLVESAVTFARLLGVSELVIGLTIVAAGTSLPEVATSVIASLRGERDIAVGNVIGSCLFNILCVLGLSAAIAPQGVSVPSAALWFDLPVMVAVSVACLPIFASGHRIARWEGALFLGYYVAYTIHLIFAALETGWLSPFRVLMVAFVIPLTVITLAVVAVREWRARAAEV
ncbi:calcium/sodium antiporter [Tautonia rosea]|uniref:calcium/sodium antiporter n=1 Tax=Tautonia rosea TaxID=2728037 RepID=UPI001474E7CC|nr:calcium/sodium antiporter [Tautonia rosea]